ncbi:MAG: type I-C CRISPR-associated protein Cas8c/Csd1 [Victivallales bacterium]
MRSDICSVRKPEPATEKELKHAADSFNAFRELHLACEKWSDSAFSAVCRFLEKWEPREAANYPFLAEATGYGVFRIKAEPGYVHERPAIVDYFKRTRMKTADQNAVTGQCLIWGRLSRLRVCRR